MAKKKQPTHPGILLKKYLDKNKLTLYRVSKDTKIDPSLISKIIKGERPVSPLVSICLGKYFGLPEDFWMIEQVKFDLGVVKLEKEVLIHSVRVLGKDEN